MENQKGQTVRCWWQVSYDGKLGWVCETVTKSIKLWQVHYDVMPQLGNPGQNLAPIYFDFIFMWGTKANNRQVQISIQFLLHRQVWKHIIARKDLTNVSFIKQPYIHDKVV